MSPGPHVFQIAGDDMLIEGEAEAVEAFDLSGPDIAGDIITAKLGDDSYATGAEEAHAAPEITRRPAAKPKLTKLRPATLGRPVKLKDLE